MPLNEVAIDPSAPIIPATSLGGLRLRTHVTTIERLLDTALFARGDDSWIRHVPPYDVSYRLGPVEVAIDIRNGAIYRLTALEGYTGTFGAISIGLETPRALALDPDLFFSDSDDLLLKAGCDGISLGLNLEDIDPHEFESTRIAEISVFVPEAFI